MITFSIQGQEQLIARFEGMGDRIHAALLKKMHVITQDLRNYIIQNKLSGQVLKKDTGKLQQSIQENVIDAPQTVTGEVFFDTATMPYGAIHEYGGTTKPHVILPVKAKALAFMAGGNAPAFLADTGNSKAFVTKIFAKKVNHPGSKMPERSFMRSSLADKYDSIQQNLNDAVSEGAA